MLVISQHHNGTRGTQITCSQVHYHVWLDALYGRGLYTASCLIVFIYILYLYTLKYLGIYTPTLVCVHVAMLCSVILFLL